jgi:hypothetical protein
MVHERVHWRRYTCTYPHTRRIIKLPALIAVEDLSGHRMIKNPGRSRNITDAAWSEFSLRLSAQAVSAG